MKNPKPSQVNPSPYLLLPLLPLLLPPPPPPPPAVLTRSPNVSGPLRCSRQHPSRWRRRSREGRPTSERHKINTKNTSVGNTQPRADSLKYLFKLGSHSGRYLDSTPAGGDAAAEKALGSHSGRYLDSTPAGGDAAAEKADLRLNERNIKTKITREGYAQPRADSLKYLLKLGSHSGRCSRRHASRWRRHSREGRPTSRKKNINKHVKHNSQPRSR